MNPTTLLTLFTTTDRTAQHGTVSHRIANATFAHTIPSIAMTFKQPRKDHNNLASPRLATTYLSHSTQPHPTLQLVMVIKRTNLLTTKPHQASCLPYLMRRTKQITTNQPVSVPGNPNPNHNPSKKKIRDRKQKKSTNIVDLPPLAYATRDILKNQKPRKTCKNQEQRCRNPIKPSWDLKIRLRHVSGNKRQILRHDCVEQITKAKKSHAHARRRGNSQNLLWEKLDHACNPLRDGLSQNRVLDNR